MTGSCRLVLTPLEFTPGRFVRTRDTESGEHLLLQWSECKSNFPKDLAGLHVQKIIKVRSI